MPLLVTYLSMEKAFNKKLTGHVVTWRGTTYVVFDGEEDARDELFEMAREKYETVFPDWKVVKPFDWEYQQPINSHGGMNLELVVPPGKNFEKPVTVTIKNEFVQRLETPVFAAPDKFDPVYGYVFLLVEVDDKDVDRVVARNRKYIKIATLYKEWDE